jgi:hypothetical protein
MNAIVKMLRSLRVNGPADAAFENYYGALVRGHNGSGPSAAEARRDFAAVRHVMDRVNFY